MTPRPPRILSSQTLEIVHFICSWIPVPCGQPPGVSRTKQKKGKSDVLVYYVLFWASPTFILRVRKNPAKLPSEKLKIIDELLQERNTKKGEGTPPKCHVSCRQLSRHLATKRDIKRQLMTLGDHGPLNGPC